MKIGFFDSGIGGISVLHQAMQLMPNEDYLYYADMDHVPYGLKTTEEICQYVEQAVHFIHGQGVKALVVACNTATSVAIERVRQRYDFPILGMEPAVKPAVINRVGACVAKRVLVTATPVTLREEKLQHLLTQWDEDNVVDLLPLPDLVGFAERGQFDTKEVVDYLQQQLAPYLLSEYCTVVLGCTHFNFFRDTMARLIPSHVEIIDGSVGTVNNLYQRLSCSGLLEQKQGNVVYYESGRLVEQPQQLQRYASLLHRLGKMDLLK